MKACFQIAECSFAFGWIRLRAMTSVFVDEIDFVSSSMKFYTQ